MVPTTKPKTTNPIIRKYSSDEFARHPAAENSAQIGAEIGHPGDQANLDHGEAALFAKVLR